MKVVTVKGYWERLHQEFECRFCGCQWTSDEFTVFEKKPPNDLVEGFEVVDSCPECETVVTKLIEGVTENGD